MKHGEGNVLVLTMLSALAQVINFGYRVVMARMVGAEVMGLYQLVMSAYGVIQSITTIGLTSALSNLTAQYLAVGNRLGAHRLRGTCLRLFFCLMTPVGLVTILCSDAISVHLLGDARTQLGLILLIPCLTLTAVENLHKNAFYGAGRPIPPAVAEVWEQIVRAGCVLGLLLLFMPQYPERAVGLVMWGMILCEVSSAVTLYTLYRQYFCPPPAGNVREEKRRQRARVAAIAVPVAANALLGNLLGAANATLVPRQLVRGGMERSLAISRLGVVCGMTLPMLALPTVYLGALNLVLMPKLARAAALGKREEMRQLISGGMKTVCSLTIPCMTMMVLFGEELGQLLYGREDVGEYLLPLAVAMGINCCVSVLATALNSIGRQRTVAGISLLGGSVQVLCTLGLMSLPGVEMGGYVAGAVVSAVLELILCLAAAVHAVKLRLEVKRWLLAPALAATLSGLNASLLLKVLRNAGLVQPAASGASFLFALGQYFLVWNLLNGEKREGQNAEKTKLKN